MLCKSSNTNYKANKLSVNNTLKRLVVPQAVFWCNPSCQLLSYSTAVLYVSNSYSDIFYSLILPVRFYSHFISLYIVTENAASSGAGGNV